MQVIHGIETMQEWALTSLRGGTDCGFVPTMGALHEGHLSLVDRAVAENDNVVMSIFVNPIQFNEEGDYQSYPVDLELDARLAEEAGVDVLFAPTPEAMYAPGRDTIVQVNRLASRLCGISRGRGHFIGVCTVVAKLFNIVMPRRAYFGQKDAQQAIIIQRMVTDLNFPVEIVVCPIVREEDGLAMSSRNVRIPPELRPSALRLHHALEHGRAAIAEGERDAAQLMNAMAEQMLEEPCVEVDYIDILSPETLEDVARVDDVVLIAGAVRVGGVRLIDNVLVDPGR